jgi:hypothetical protein
MNLFETLRQLKKIYPDNEYTRRVRQHILSSAQETAMPRLTLAQFLWQNLQLGSAIALTGLLLLLGFGGFSAWRFLSPYGLNSLDPANLRAEAGAVNDIQVALNSVQYLPLATDTKPLPAAKNNPTGSTMSLRAAPAPLSATQEGIGAAGEGSSASGTEDETPPPDFSSTTVDAALDYLMQ